MGVQIRALLAWLAYATLAYTQFLRSPRDVRGLPGASRVTSFGHVQYSVDIGTAILSGGLLREANLGHVVNPCGQHIDKSSDRAGVRLNCGKSPRYIVP